MRLTDRQARALTARADRELRERTAAEEHARAEWALGHVYPHRITLALDRRMLDGPEVDRACGVEEPAVDWWEQGRLYPTWSQLLALADLTRFPVGWFTRPSRHVVEFEDTTLRFHVRDPGPGPRGPLPVLCFTEQALAEHFNGTHACPACRRPR